MYASSHCSRGLRRQACFLGRTMAFGLLTSACTVGTPSERVVDPSTTGSGETTSGETTSDGTSTGSESTTTGTSSSSTGATSSSSEPSVALEKAEPISSANVYWVGHSLISGADPRHDGKALYEVLGELVEPEGYAYDYYKHTVPGSPLNANWGDSADAWNGSSRDNIQPLVNPSHARYGSFDAIVVTEAVPVTDIQQWTKTGFFARQFFCAARRANPDAALYVYESWPNFQGENPYTSIYDPREEYDFMAFSAAEHPSWEAIQDEAANPALTPEPTDGYSWRGEGDDPGTCEGELPVRLVPTGEVLRNFIRRLRERRSGDDWSLDTAVRDGQMSELDLFLNPLADFPADMTTAVHSGEIDDIHPTYALTYLNAITHFAVVFHRDPAPLPALNGVPENIASIMKEVAWQTVTSDPRTGLRAP